MVIKSKKTTVVDLILLLIVLPLAGSVLGVLLSSIYSASDNLIDMLPFVMPCVILFTLYSLFGLASKSKYSLVLSEKKLVYKHLFGSSEIELGDIKKISLEPLVYGMDLLHYQFEVESKESREKSINKIKFKRNKFDHKELSNLFKEIKIRNPALEFDNYVTSLTQNNREKKTYYKLYLSSYWGINQIISIVIFLILVCGVAIYLLKR